MIPTFKKHFYVLLALHLAACEEITETPQKHPVGADLTGGAVRPTAVSTSAEGRLSGLLQTLGDQAVLEYEIEFSGLSDTATAAHIHGPASADNAGAILVDFSAPPAGSVGTIQLGAEGGTGSGTIDLKTAITATVSGDSLHKLIGAGLVYVDIHTATHSAGEIRGQVTLK